MTFKLIAIGAVAMLLACSGGSDNNEQSPSISQETRTDTVPRIADATMIQILKNVFEATTTEDLPGKEVPLKDAMPCIERYEADMKLHGFDKDEDRDVDLRINKTKKTTQSVNFVGINLLKWMIATIIKLDPDGLGKNVGIRLTMGIYTKKFLDDHEPDAGHRMKKKNRITIFVVAYDKRTGKIIKTDDGSAYNLGGLQP